MDSNFCFPFRVVEFFLVFSSVAEEMAAAQLTSAASSISAAKGFASFEGLRATQSVKIASFSPLKQSGLSQRSFRGLVVKAATAVAPKV